MRFNHLRMVEGLVDLCFDIRHDFQNRSIEFVEIGSYIGESTQIFLNHLDIDKMYCIDKWSITDKYGLKEISEAESIFNLLHGSNEKVCIHKRDSRDSLLKSINPDVVYIDASHRYEDVSKDIDFWLPLIKKGGVICGHDYCNRSPGVIKAVDERFEYVKRYKDDSWAVFNL